MRMLAAFLWVISMAVALLSFISGVAMAFNLRKEDTAIFEENLDDDNVIINYYFSDIFKTVC